MTHPEQTAATGTEGHTPDVAATIARNAKGLRKAHRLTLQEVADRGGLAKSYVWEIENGKNTNPSIKTLVSLCRALGCSLDGLVGMQTHMKPQLRPEAMRIAVEVDTLLRAALQSKGEFQRWLHTHQPIAAISRAEGRTEPKAGE